MFHRFGSINKNQKGFTMVELLIAVAITAVIVGSVTTVIFQVFTGNTRTSNHMTAVRQVQNAGYWVSHDVQMANSVNATGAAGFPLLLTWVKWEDGTSDNVTYALTSSQLVRTEKVGAGLPKTTVVARYITQASCNLTSGRLIFNVTATVGSGSLAKSETRVYEIVPRPSQ